MSNTDSVVNELRDKNYYLKAKEGSLEFDHPGMVFLKKEVLNAKKILDLGCGEGTRLNFLINGLDKEAVGIDASQVGINLAKKQYPKIKFICGNLNSLPFSKDEFDLVFSAFVFEHLNNPELALKEAVRVVKDKGKIIIIAPNFGAPNRRSPNSKEGKLLKLLKGFWDDLKLLFYPKKTRLNWVKVEPQSSQYTIDADTVIEPYLDTLEKYTRNLHLRTVFVSSFWGLDKRSFFQFLFRILGQLNIYPFSYWGPHLFIILEKL